MAQLPESNADQEKPEYIEIYCKCGSTMKLTTPSQCTISIGLQCNNNKCKKILEQDEWFYHCVENSSNGKVHKGPYNYCNRCAHLKKKLIAKQTHYTYLKEGWMMKKPTNHLIKTKQFKRRYFKLSSEWKLWYFVDANSLYNKDMIDLNYMTSIKKQHSNGFEIYESKGKNQWLFVCETAEERDEWYNIMLLAYQSKQQQENQDNDTSSNHQKSQNETAQNPCLSTKNTMIYGDDDL